ncbi:putative methyltransferase type 11, S-adenosyl-L-methionine-dependent methyltransferase [Helianthus debilis subsp. tardiflorus]
MDFNNLNYNSLGHNNPYLVTYVLPLVSFLYERGWRQGFSLWAGFPGPEKEFEMMKDYLNPVTGGRIIDASCASGIFSRIFAKSELFSLVVALDFSETMLKQCYDFIKQEQNISQEYIANLHIFILVSTTNFSKRRTLIIYHQRWYNGRVGNKSKLLFVVVLRLHHVGAKHISRLILVRADIARLPFASSSIDVVHAGAALHCWPSPSAGVAEISRILRPGGVFVATTYIIDGPLSFIPFLSLIRKVGLHLDLALPLPHPQNTNKIMTMRKRKLIRASSLASTFTPYLNIVGTYLGKSAKLPLHMDP